MNNLLSKLRIKDHQKLVISWVSKAIRMISGKNRHAQQITDHKHEIIP